MSLDTATAFDPPILGALEPGAAAVFLDFDGVLVDIAPSPDSIEVPDTLISLLAVLEAQTSGGCAIVTGRPVDDLRRHLPSVPRSVIGSHGAELSLAGTAAFRHPLIGSETVARMHDMADRARRFDGVRVERKPTGIALHFRAAPEQAETVTDFASALVGAFDGFEMLAAKAAVELRPAGIGKDKAVARAMALPAFAGRTPVYFGDDTTDEPALDWVNRCGGIAVKVGAGDTVAPIRVATPAQARQVLAEWLEPALGER